MVISPGAIYSFVNLHASLTDCLGSFMKKPEFSQGGRTEKRRLLTHAEAHLETGRGVERVSVIIWI
jgi:hypothetical protein